MKSGVYINRRDARSVVAGLWFAADMELTAADSNRGVLGKVMPDWRRQYLRDRRAAQRYKRIADKLWALLKEKK